MDDEPTRVGKVEGYDASKSKAKRDRPYFIVLAGSNLGKMFKIDADDVIIGRSSEARVRLEDDGISRKHARVFMDHGELWIEDLKSANGTIINGQRADRQKLRDGDKIQVGATTILKFTYHDELDDNFQQKMYDAALHDGLTKAFNKRHFLERLSVEVAYARRHKTPLTLIMLDVDHFKQVNDKHGHLAGDHVLIGLAAIVEKQLRTEDLFARYGGEEFAVLCRGCSLGNASLILGGARARRWSRAVGLRARRQQDARHHQHSASAAPLGRGCGRRRDGATQLVADADAALYDAKRGGWNRVVARSRVGP